MEIVLLLLLTLRERSLSMKLCHLVASLEEESLSSVWLYWKDLVGMFLIIVLLSPTSLDKVKDAPLSVVHAAAVALSLMSTALEAAKDVLHMAEEVVTVAVTLFLMVADTTNLMTIMIVRMTMLTTMPHYLACKYSEEEQEASVSLVLLAQEVVLARTLSVSSILVLVVAHLLNSKCKLEATRSSALKRSKEL